MHVTRSMAARIGAISTALAVAVTTFVAFAGTAQTVTPQTAGLANAVTAAPAGKVVARNPQGVMRSRIVGNAGSRKVTGSFVPLAFVEKDGQLLAEGLVMGKLHGKKGKARTFSAMREIPVASVNDVPTARSARAACDILNLDLGPLDLDILGLEVHLDRVVLDIVARSGAGNLLGNLLCAVAGLLDGGPLAGLLGQLGNLLNQILAALRLGV